MKADCIAERCDRPSRARGLCNAHYKRDRYRSRPGYGGPRRFNDIAEAFAARTESSGDCVIWTGLLFDSGHGSVSVNGSSRFAHRVAYEREVGPVPEGKILDHECRNPPCVNVKHLRVVTPKQNGENRKGPNRNNGTSNYMGVSFDKKTGRWSAKVMHDRKSFWAGRHDTEEQAARAAQNLRNELFTHNDIDRPQHHIEIHDEAPATAGASALEDQ